MCRQVTHFERSDWLEVTWLALIMGNGNNLDFKRLYSPDSVCITRMDHKYPRKSVLSNQTSRRRRGGGGGGKLESVIKGNQVLHNHVQYSIHMYSVHVVGSHTLYSAQMRKIRILTVPPYFQHQ